MYFFVYVSIFSLIYLLNLVFDYFVYIKYKYIHTAHRRFDFGDNIVLLPLF